MTTNLCKYTEILYFTNLTQIKIIDNIALVRILPESEYRVNNILQKGK